MREDLPKATPHIAWAATNETVSRRPESDGAFRICLVASVPSTFQAFYTPLLDALRRIRAEVVLVASTGEELWNLAAKHGTATRGIPVTRAFTPWRDVRSLFALIGLFRTHRFDIVHTHTPKAGLLGMVAARMARVPVRIHTLHGLPLETAAGLKRRLLLSADRGTCASAHRISVVSRSLLDRARALRIGDPERMTLLGDGSACGVDVQRFSRNDDVMIRSAAIRERLGIAPTAPVIGYVGWIVADKGIADLVQAFLLPADRHKDIRLLLVGPDGAHRDPVSPSTLHTMREHPRIDHVGPADDPVPYYAAMDLCVLPTRREGFPYALLEAGAMGIATVATRVTGCVDAVVDGETGMLVPPGRVDELVTAIDALIRDADHRKRLGEAARRRVVRGFACDRLVAEHLSMYRSELERSRMERGLHSPSA